MMLAMQAVIRAARESPQPPPGAVDRELGDVVARLVALHGRDVEVLDQLDSPSVDRRKVCRMALALYEESIARRDGRLARAIFSQK
jgi:hypothetical protein